MCGHEFTFEDAKFEDSFVYTLSQEVREEISRGLLYLNQFRKTLEDNGYTIITPPILKDPSGIEYNFDIVAGDSKGMTITVDINFSNIPLTRTQIIEKFGKYSATNKTSILVLVPKLESEINKLAESIGMIITQADNAAGALQQFSERASKLKKAEKHEKKSRGWSPLGGLLKRGTNRDTRGAIDEHAIDEHERRTSGEGLMGKQLSVKEYFVLALLSIFVLFYMIAILSDVQRLNMPFLFHSYLVLAMTIIILICLAVIWARARKPRQQI